VSDSAERRARFPEHATAVLDARTLDTAHRRLAALLRPGMRVLDVGCGTGAITRGVAERVAPGGRVVGADRSPELLRRARRTHAGISGLAFVVADAHALPFRAAFDVVTGARVLQWLARPGDALRAMAGATRPGGRVVVLEYNHEKIVWTPEPPASVRCFYDAFLAWRREAGMDNALADRLPALFRATGLVDVAVSAQHEVAERGDPWLALWADVAASRGRQMVDDGAITEDARARAEADCRAWARDAAERQVMYLLAVEGVRPTPVPDASPGSGPPA
jgi:SAM-dependent methyltransferase